MFKKLTLDTINIPKLISLLNIKSERQEREEKNTQMHADQVLEASNSNKNTKMLGDSYEN